MNENSLKSRQIRAARALLDWSQDDLADHSALSVATIRKIESGHLSPRGKTSGSIRKAFEENGLEFLYPDGVRHRPDDIQVYQGLEEYLDFFDDVYKSVKRKKSQVVIVTPSEALFNNVCDPKDNPHFERMALIKDSVSVKCIVTEDKDTISASAYCEYRYISKQYVNSVPFYVYDDKYAIFTLNPATSPKITVIQSHTVAEAFRAQFYSMWEKATPLNTVDRNTAPQKRTAVRGGK